MTQHIFRRALLEPGLPIPPGLFGPDGAAAGRRFDIYRNNVAVGLKDALAASFPVLRALLGDVFFGAMSGLFLRAHPPATPLMMFYGDSMPGFLAAFQPAAHLGYLPDVARLELAIRRSYHAADAAPVDPASLQSLPTEAFLRARPVFAPAMLLLRSDWPLFSIWSANTRGTPPPSARTAEDVVVLRPEFDPVPHLLPPNAGAFLAALTGGATFGEAITAAPGDFDLGATVGLLVTGGAIRSLSFESHT
jgi:hypothetical protein